MNRSQLLRIHKYAGLAMAALLLVQALTGALLLYRGPVARWIDPAEMTSQGAAPTISAGVAVTQAELALPGYAVARLFMPDVQGATFLAELSDAHGTTRYASIDPAGGKVLHAGTVWAFPVEAALQIHYRLMAGKAGMAVILLNALVLFTMATTGLGFWWPKRGPIAKHLSIRWTLAFRLVLRQAHRTLGVLASLVLAFLALTGLLLIIPELIAAGDPAPHRLPVSAARVDRSLTMAQSVFPQSALRDFRLAGDRLTVNFHAPERNPRAVHRTVVTIAEPHIISATRAENNRALWMTILPLHAGNSLGTAGPLLWLVAALVLVVLSLSGPIMWWQAKAVRRRSALKKQPA
ncbi:MAG TPA: PepSY-associated TM helix domain-containing protein [Sphingobium sp.]|nr:PepSY-associated TM helix domain-containing protein [Sphingobium sp.]